MIKKYEIQIHIDSATIIDARSETDLISRPWGIGDITNPFAIFTRDLQLGETIEIDVLGKSVSFTAPEK